MAVPASLANVVETIRSAVARIFLLTGLGALLSVTTGRLARVIDRARVLGGKVRHNLLPLKRAELGLMPKGTD